MTSGRFGQTGMLATLWVRHRERIPVRSETGWTAED